MVADLHSASTTLAALPPVAWITRQLNDAQRAISSEPKPATELCGTAAEFMGMLDGEAEDW